MCVSCESPFVGALRRTPFPLSGVWQMLLATLLNQRGVSEKEIAGVLTPRTIDVEPRHRRSRGGVRVPALWSRFRRSRGVRLDREAAPRGERLRHPPCLRGAEQLLDIPQHRRAADGPRLPHPPLGEVARLDGGKASRDAGRGARTAPAPGRAYARRRRED